MRSSEFSDVLITRTIIEVKKNPSIGRKSLSSKIGISEGSMRALLKYLKKQNIVAATRKGHFLTPAGEQIIDEFLKYASFPFEISLPDMTQNKCTGIILRNLSEKINSGIEERDAAIREGCNGAFVFLYTNEGFKFPSINISILDYPVSNEYLNNLAKQENLKNGDVVVICFADHFINAENGVIKISLNKQNFNWKLLNLEI